MQANHNASITITVEEGLRLAVEHHRSGRLNEAEVLYRGILQANPAHPDANHNLGLIAVQTGHVDASLPLFKAALDACPDFPQYWISYIDALEKVGQPDDAAELLLKARQAGLTGEAIDSLGAKLNHPEDEDELSLLKFRLVEAFNRGEYAETETLAQEMNRNHPNEAIGWKVLGAALTQMGRAPEALAAMQKALQLVPLDAEARLNLGVVLTRLGRLVEAVAHYRQAIAIHPDYAEAHCSLGNALAIQKDFAGAEASYRKAIAIKPDVADSHNNLGNVQYYRGNLNDAVASYRKAIALAPDSADPYNNLGNALRILGKLDEAEQCCRKAIAIRAGFAEAHNNLGNLYKDAGRIGEAVECYQRALSCKQDLVECHRNLSELKKFTRDDPQLAVLRQLYEKTANESDRSKICFGLGKAMEDLKEFDEAFTLYEEGNALRKKELGYDIGQDRVLIDRIKSAFEVLPEVEPVLSTGASPILIVGMPRSGTSLAEQILASHSRVHGAGELETLSTRVQKHFIDTQVHDPALASRSITSEYFEELGSVSEGSGHITDKMPLNFRWLGFLLLANPEIRVVHTIRDPMATCWSIFRQYFPASGLGFAYGLADLAEYYAMYRDLMAFWHEKFPGRIYDLDYEKLTENQQEETRKLLEYCGLPWEDACLEFHQTERVVKTASAAQVRKKMYKGSSEAWRKFEKHLGPLKSGLGLK